jgi:hypothetical protein
MEITSKGEHDMFRINDEGEIYQTGDLRWSRAIRGLHRVERTLRTRKSDIAGKEGSVLKAGSPDGRQPQSTRAGVQAGAKLLLAIAALAFAGVMSVVPARAQEMTMVVHIPFSFTVASSSLPAGDYTLLRQDGSQPFWIIQNNVAHTGVIALVGVDGLNGQSGVGELVFERLGTKYLLSQIQYPGLTSELPISRRKRSLEKETARNQTSPESLAVLASLRQ